MELPKPRLKGNVSLEEAIHGRRSVRYYKAEPLHLEELSQLLWSCQGITHAHGYRAAPSAGALYPLEIYVLVNRVKGLEKGVYKYLPRGHGIELKLPQREGSDLQAGLYQAALSQEWVLRAAVNFIVTAIYERTTQKYGERGIRYVHMEAGHAAQNLLLQGEVLGLGGVVVGAFYDREVKSVLKIDEEPLYIIPVGRK